MTTVTLKERANEAIEAAANMDPSEWDAERCREWLSEHGIDWIGSGEHVLPPGRRTFSSTASLDAEELRDLVNDHAEPDQEYDDAWRPIADRLYKQPCPQDREGEADGYGADYAGALPTGELVIWADIQGSRRRIFRVIRGGSE